ncbi:cell division protein ftsQ [Clostridium sp. CAG:798]|nr:cell division protein ftsQ [Clostridium sp. CAG:798]
MAKKAKEDLNYKKNTKNKVNKNAKSNKITNPNKESNLFDFDKEIVIGMPKIPETKQQKNKRKNKNISNNKKKPAVTKKISKKQEMAIKKRKLILKIIRTIVLIGILIGTLIYILLSPLFNIKDVTVTGNNKLSRKEIISLSEIRTEENIFKTSKNDIKNKIKTNPYVENVKIRRKLPDKVEIIVVERVATYMLPFANSYVYINNQGYMLEITSQKANLPIITGFSTPEENLHEGERLLSEDLVKLGEVLQIIESANANGIQELITKIDMSNRQDYTIMLEKEKKLVHMGDVSNLSTKMSYINKIIQDEAGIEGEIFVNTDLTNKGAVFREKV